MPNVSVSAILGIESNFAKSADESKAPDFICVITIHPSSTQNFVQNIEIHVQCQISLPTTKPQNMRFWVCFTM